MYHFSKSIHSKQTHQQRYPSTLKAGKNDNDGQRTSEQFLTVLERRSGKGNEKVNYYRSPFIVVSGSMGDNHPSLLVNKDCSVVVKGHTNCDPGP